jgi:hypothetical protein
VIVWVNSIMMMFGQVAPFYLLWNGPFCTCKMQVQAKLQQFWGSLRKSPTPTPSSPKTPNAASAASEARAMGDGAIVRDRARWAPHSTRAGLTTTHARAYTRPWPLILIARVHYGIAARAPRVGVVACGRDWRRTRDPTPSNGVVARSRAAARAMRRRGRSIARGRVIDRAIDRSRARSMSTSMDTRIDRARARNTRRRLARRATRACAAPFVDDRGRERVIA